MSNRVAASTPPRVEAYDWIETSRLSELVANFARVHILIALFDGEPDKWLEFISTDGTSEEREFDVPFLLHIRDRIDAEPQLLDEMRRMLQQFSMLFARVPLPA
jgi:hypothetical protein